MSIAAETSKLLRLHQKACQEIMIANTKEIAERQNTIQGQMFDIVSKNEGLTTPQLSQKYEALHGKPVNAAAHLKFLFDKGYVEREWVPPSGKMKMGVMRYKATSAGLIHYGVHIDTVEKPELSVGNMGIYERIILENCTKWRPYGLSANYARTAMEKHDSGVPALTTSNITAIMGNLCDRGLLTVRLVVNPENRNAAIRCVRLTKDAEDLLTRQGEQEYKAIPAMDAKRLYFAVRNDGAMKAVAGDKEIEFNPDDTRRLYEMLKAIHGADQ